MLSSNYELYNKYLLQTSFKGYLYKRFFLYPKLDSFLTGKCLDVGCGIGTFVKYRKNTDGADINHINIASLEKTKKRGFLIENNKIPVPNESYNSVIMDNVLEHIQDPNDLVQEVFRVLKPNGHFLIGVPGQKGFISEVDHKIYYDLKSANELMSKFDFEYQKHMYTPFKWSVLDKHLKQYCLYIFYKKKAIPA